ncbi:MAG: hypothetical protein OEY59_13335 [Deltaproteobacteria bacterium]|nr:hypothetical protein [Deltaproteobacteria bacterium]
MNGLLKQKKTVISTILLALLFWGCSEKTQDQPVGQYQATSDPSISITYDRLYLDQKISLYNSALDITTDQLNSVKNSTAPLEGKLLKKGKPVDDVALSFIGEVNSASVSGVALQATDVAIKGNKAYVSYNMAGDEFLGALQVLDISQKLKPKIEAEIVFSDMELNAVYVKGNQLFVVGAGDSSKRTLTSPAVLTVFDLSGGLPDTDVKVVDLPSFAATDVIAQGKYLYITVGDQGGGLVRVLASQPESFDETFDFYAVDDARSVAVEQKTLGVLKGTDGEVRYFDTDILGNPAVDLSLVSPLRTVSMPGTATIIHSKSVIDMPGNVTVMALGDGGVMALLTDSTSDQTIIDIPALTGVSGLTDAVTVSNATSVNQNLLFRANGEAGVEIFKLSQNIRSVKEGDPLTVTKLGSLAFGSLESANGLYYRKGLLFVADGLGGMKIVEVDRNITATADETEDGLELDQDEEDA